MLVNQVMITNRPNITSAAFLTLINNYPIIYVYETFMDAHELVNSIVRGWIWPKFEIIQVPKVVLGTFKYEKDLIKIAKKK